ncbi:DUF1553 domain-containing protein [bacterium]|nr:DUF1553 domain-containing protein [bacterium]
MFRLVMIAALIWLISAEARAAGVDYLRDVKPLLQEKCFTCHGALKQESGLRADTAASLLKGGDSGAAIVAGKPDESLLVDVLTGDAGFRMPPDGEGAPLTDDEISLIVRWIQNGATAPEGEEPQSDPHAWWSYLPIADPAVPTPADPAWRASPIDAFIAAARDERGLTPRQDAPPAVWLRRVYLDLIGLPPTREELLAFLRDDSRSARERVVDDLLTRPQYGERWGRHWMDIWRYSDWYGRRESNEIRYSQRHIWRWRDWIIDSLNADKGYDQMIREMLAADEIASDDPAILPATGYLGRNWYKFDRNVWLFDTVEKTSEALLGLTMRCSRCHDHKYDPITQQDYYRFRAFFEPHDVRIDPVSASVPTETDNGADKVLADGIPRIFDKEIEAKTFVFRRGDGRYPDEENPLTPAVPAIFGGDPVTIEPVQLPPGAYYPAMRPEVRQTFVEQADQRIAELTKQLADAKAAVETTTATVEKVRLAAAEKANADSTTASDFLNDDFSKPQPDVWKTVSGDWAYAGGHLVEKAVASFATIVTQQNHPANFQAKLRYVPLQPGTYRSIGFSFDYQDQGNSQDVYTSTGDARQSVQAFHRTGGQQVYPQAGIVPTELKVGEPAELFVTVRGTQLSIDLNGKRKLDYVLPIKRQAGKFALWVHAGSAEFHSLQISELTESLDDQERKLRDAQHAVTLAEVKLKTGQAERDAVNARIAADVAQHFSKDEAEQQRTASEASKAERAVAALNAEVIVADFEYQLTELRVAKAVAASIEKLEKQLADARTKLEAAKAAVETPDGKYAPIGNVYPKTSTGRRTALANWIASPSNPRTARVAANHLWNRHFGRPLVDTTENFGLNGRVPTHPQLLDWLATELIRNDWKLKPLHRQIVLSKTYALASTPDDDQNNAKLDPENRYYWRSNSRRMEAEVVRDSVLFLAGQLDLQRGGPDIAPDQGDKVPRRSLYFRNTPNTKMAFLETFDVADPNTCYRRRESVVPQQALALMNSDLTAVRAPLVSENIQATGSATASDSEFINAAFETVLNRHPTEQEAIRSLSFLTGQAASTDAANQTAVRTQFVHVLLLHNDFVTIR